MRQSALPMESLPAQVLLADRHYLGPSHRATLIYEDEFGVMVFAPPSARHLPKHWLELVRWCLVGGDNAGSQQWKAARTWLLARSDAQTVISYSDPSVGHTGALYRACNWLWAPTWHRLRPPPTGQGSWNGRAKQSVKDRWIAILRQDDGERSRILQIKDAGLRVAMPWAEYREPKWKRGNAVLRTGGGDYKRFVKTQSAEPA